MGYDNNLISKTRRALNDESLWEVGSQIPRTYLFSESDDLIFWKDVEEHGVRSAQTCGARSLLVRFKDTGHCGHARGNEELYWGIVKRTWETRHQNGGQEMIEVGESEMAASGSARDVVPLEPVAVDSAATGAPHPVDNCARAENWAGGKGAGASAP